MTGNLLRELGITDKRGKVVPRLIRDNHVENFAEVGVADCFLANRVLARCPGIEKYYLIDTFDLLKNFEGLTDQENVRRFEFASSLARAHKGTVVIKEFSLKAAELLPDKSLDMVFIDADHTYNAVRDDIAAWLPKIRIGGIISGHDFGLRFIGVVMAVHEAFKDRYIHLEKDSVWWVKV